MVLRIAAIYGEPFTAKHARELLSTIAGSVALRYLAQEAAKVVPVGGSVVAAGVAAAGTWAIGQVAVQYFESGKRLNRSELREAYRRIAAQAPPHLEPGMEPNLAPGPLPVPAQPPAPWDAPAAAPAPADGPRRFRLPFGRNRDAAT